MFIGRLYDIQGSLIVMTRHGLNKSDGGPLARCSFEQAHKNLLTSSIFGQTDNIERGILKYYVRTGSYWNRFI